MVLKRDDFESRKYSCERCGQLKVRKRLGARKTPRFCPDCLVVVRKAQVRKAREAKGKPELFEGVIVVAPDGFSVKLQNGEEKDYYEKRKAEYLQEFDWIDSADRGLLARLLSLEITCRRYESRFRLKESESRDRLNSVKEIRDIQEKLGILRAQRKRRKEERTPLDMVQDLIKRFNDYREKNPDRFVWICSHCGAKNFLRRENTNFTELIDYSLKTHDATYQKLEEKSGATPIVEESEII